MPTAVNYLIETLEKLDSDVEKGVICIDDYIMLKNLAKKHSKTMEKMQLKMIYEGLLQNVGTFIKQSDLPPFRHYFKATFEV
jgi:hypothetical protein